MDFTVAKLFGASVAFYRARFWIYLGLGAVFVGLPSLIGFALQPDPTLVTTSQTDASTVSELDVFMTGPELATTLLVALVSTLLFGWLQATIMIIVRDDAAGTKVSVQPALMSGLRFVLPFFVMQILFSLAVGIGFILLIVPGVILSLMWAVVGPALVLGEAGIIGAFRESQRYTKGQRVTLLLTVLLMVAIMLALTIALQVILGVAAVSLLGLIFNVVLAIVFNSFVPVFFAVAYIALRRLAGEALV